MIHPTSACSCVMYHTNSFSIAVEHWQYISLSHRSHLMWTCTRDQIIMVFSLSSGITCLSVDPPFPPGLKSAMDLVLTTHRIFQIGGQSKIYCLPSSGRQRQCLWMFVNCHLERVALQNVYHGQLSFFKCLEKTFAFYEFWILELKKTLNLKSLKTF